MASPLLVPVKLDAFVLNEAVCGGESPSEAKIAPITQPNYSYLRLGDFMLQNDVVRPIELHAAAPAKNNARVTHLGISEVRKDRLGVYVHWMIPRSYRTGAAATDRGVNRSRKRRGLEPHLQPSDDPAPEMPVFPETPNRWVVIRRLREPEAANTAPVTAWVIESDWMRSIDDFNDADIAPRKWDIEATVSPYMDTGSAAQEHGSIDKQAEVFIGGRDKASEWSPEKSEGRKRVSLGVLNSSNQLFPDYQPHNTNVFSMIDTFEADDGSYLDTATADYFVLGWQSDPTQDLLHLEGSSLTRGDRLDALSLALHGTDDPSEGVAAWLKSTAGGRILCHGAMYDVRWDRNSKPPSVPADDVAQEFQDRMPLAVGTTPLDALLAYVAAHELKDTEELLAKISELLHAQSERLEDRRAAQDEVQNYNFARFAAGSHYVLDIDEENPAKPPETGAAELLATLNQSQTLYDSTGRQIQQLQWALFSVWWKYSTDKQRDEKKDNYTALVDQLQDQLQSLGQILDQQSSEIRKAKAEFESIALNLKEATAPVLTQQQEPTLFLGDVRSGWPLDYLDPLAVRLEEHIEPDGLPDLPEPGEYGLECLPDSLKDAAGVLVREFLFYGDQSDSSRSTVKDKQEVTAPPLYHLDGRDQWNNQQPWFPLFLEWEAEYYHVDYSEWDIETKTSNSSDATKFRYTIKQGDHPLWETDGILNDRRKLTGRILLLPQPVFSLQAQIERLFSSVPKEQLDQHLSAQEREQLLKEVINLPFVSAPLDGFTNHLLTLAEGSHLKPNMRYPGQGPQPLEDAAKDSSEIGITQDAIRNMGLETDLTPYGSLVRLDHSAEAKNPAFKPVTHGQFKFTKLNVIDKFGQAACVIDPRRRVEGPPPVFPCLGEYYEPQAYKETADPNVVEEPDFGEGGGTGQNQYIQVPPSINQPSRLHMNFVTLDHLNGDTYWRPVTEWENPIWGWVLVNYVNHGIQFFLPDGTFYREVRIAAPNNPNGGTQTEKWVPFKPPRKTDAEQGQIDRLIDQFTEGGRNYLLAFMDLINIATVRAQSVPGAYSQCVNSVIGRPLALVNAGISLELGYAPKQGQSTFAGQESKRQPWSLLPDENADEQYEFAVKLGDKDRSYDGLVGYFRTREEPEKEDGLELGDLYTPHTLDNFQSDQIHLIGNDNFPRLKPFWLSPSDYSDVDFPDSATAATQFTLDRHKQQTVFGFLMDPFSPVNAYSSIQPIEPLALPPWTWQSALKSMTAFFHFGPLVVADDVPAYDPSARLEYDYKLTDEEQTVSGNNIKLPSLAVADWSWLQPYEEEDIGQRTNEDEDAAYMALDIGTIDPVPTWEKGPLTAVEGFLQMKKSITAPDIDL